MMIPLSAETGAQFQTRDRRYWLRLALFFVVSVGLVLALLPLLLGSLFTASLLYAPCAGNGPDPARFNLTAEPLTLGRIEGYYIPGQNGAVIIMPPPFNAGRGDRLPEAAVLADHGYGIVLFESRPCAGMQPHSLGYNEVEDVATVLDYLAARPELAEARLGIHGFSSAGATAIMAAARYPQLAAVVAEGGYGDFARNTLPTPTADSWYVNYFNALYTTATRWTYRLLIGAGIDQLSPTSTIEQVAPRPVLLIYGSREATLVGAREQAAAGSSAELWIVEGAGHGNYLAIAPEEYEQHLVEFFDAALLGEN